MYITNNINETEMVYSLLREKYPENQVNISYDYNARKYTLIVTDEKYENDPEVRVDVYIRTIYGDTDSIFISLKYNREDFRKNREDSFNLASICGNNITKMFNRHTIELEFEKVFQPFILLTKKRYIGNKYDNMKDPFKLSSVINSGTAVTRRDFCKMVKNCYKEIIDCIVSEGNDNGIEQSVEIYKSYIDRIDNYQIDIDDLITSKTLAKSYNCALCKEKCEWSNLICINKCRDANRNIILASPGTERCRKCKTEFKCCHKFNLVHIQLAIRMLNRKEDANVNDRIPYVFIESENKKLAKSDLGEDPLYVKKNNIKYNRSFYLESLAKTILPFFKICLTEHENLLDDVIEYTNNKFEYYGYKKLKPSDYKMEED